jgi:hypothetical protein
VWGFSVAAAAANELERLMPLAPLLAAVGESPEAPADRTEPGDVRMGLISRVQARLEERVSASPALVCLDDIDHADPVTMLALRILTQHLASYRLVWLLARSAEGGGDAKRLFDLLESDGAVRIELHSLTDAVVAGLIADVLAAEPDAGLLKLAGGADGNPLVLTALLDGLREEGACSFRRAAPRWSRIRRRGAFSGSCMTGWGALGHRPGSWSRRAPCSGPRSRSRTPP